MQYITGSHAFKAGFQLQQGSRNMDTIINGDVQYQFLGGVPVAVRQYATPYLAKDRMKADLGIFVQDHWTVQRLALNYGVRLDYFNAYVPEQHLPAGPWVPARDFAAVHKVPEVIDLDPRFGASYDLFGAGKTAFKVSLGRYVGAASLDFTGLNNPMNTSVNQVDRPWTDANRNYVPDCDLRNFTANGECGPISNQNFGKVDARATSYADDVLHGVGHRDYNWDFATEVQHELRPGMSVTGGYYRNWYNNFVVTKNLAVTPADYTPYCITAPVDARLPGGVRSATVPLIEPQTQFEGRRTQLDVRLSKLIKLGGKARLRANFDAYNVLNANSILAIATAYGSQWRRPTSILDGRLIEFSGELTF